MEKVKVSKELFDLLESYNLKDETDENFINAIKKIINGKVFVDEKNLVLNGINPRMFLDCIYYGYELEETKEEISLKKLKELTKESDGLFNLRQDIEILEALDTLGIKIEGINE